MKQSRSAFHWIIKLLKKHKIRFQITGGLAAKYYGSPRELADIDIEISDEGLLKIAPVVKKYITSGPKHYRDKNWDLQLMTLRYKDQDIDICGADSIKLYDLRNNKWVSARTNLSKFTKAEVFGLSVPLITKTRLIKAKKLLNRRVDRIDVREMSS